ncbi:ADP-ribosylation factor, putative [Plasmodium ovale]|uniref:ADP-ribosylation factor, putative n=1 Tax=Plasmodium ovale TaxID=36330 RepID=A0A1D3U9N6_PLAOA|nr:ADP-ribosylation factor, putative [Plasmodium ovale]
MIYRFFSLKYATKKNYIIFGLPSSGKTSIVYFFKLGYLITTVRTHFVNEESLSIKIRTDKNSFDEKNYEITFYEVGQECSYNLVKNYSDISNDVIYIVDSTHKSGLREARDEFIRIIYDYRFVYRKCKFLIFMNKQDSNGCLKSEEIINYFALPNELLFRCKFFSCSTLSGQGLREGLEWLLCTHVFSEKNDVLERHRKLYYS